MPTVPIVQPPVVGPSQPSGVRADPGMYAGEAAAGRQLGGAIEGVGDFAARVKQATDTAYVIGAQTKLEKATADFHTWTLEHPDTSEWGDKFEESMNAAKEDALSGSKALSPMAKLHLSTAIDSWGKRAGASLNQASTMQNLRNAQGTGEEGVNQAIASNDTAGAHAIIDTMVSQGVFHASVGAAMKKRVTVGVATNLANADASADPFTAKDKLEAKNEDGTYMNYPGLPQPARTTMLFRASKLAAETRAESVRTWSNQIAIAQNGAGAMPDEDGVRAEAQRQGIAPKTITKLFAAPKATDPHEFAQAYTAITAYHPEKDPTHEQLGELVATVEGFKGPARDRLNTLLTAKGKPDKIDPTQKAVTTFGEHAINDMFSLGGYGKFRTRKQDDQGNWSTIVNPKVKMDAEVTQARNLDTFHQWLEQNPKASREQAQLFINNLNRTARVNALWAPPLNPLTGAASK